jgi:hypothetical protein
VLHGNKHEHTWKPIWNVYDKLTWAHSKGMSVIIMSLNSCIHNFIWHQSSIQHDMVPIDAHSIPLALHFSLTLLGESAMESLPIFLPVSAMRVQLLALSTSSYSFTALLYFWQSHNLLSSILNHKLLEDKDHVLSANSTDLLWAGKEQGLQDEQTIQSPRLGFNSYIEPNFSLILILLDSFGNQPRNPLSD